jgi:anti-anti-sigma factor
MTQIKTTVINNVVVMHPEGRIDLEGARLLDQAINQIVESDLKYPLLIDLGNVEYISSTCLSVLLTAKKSYSDRDLTIKICNANHICEKVLFITNVDKLIQIIPTYEEAIQSFK